MKLAIRGSVDLSSFISLVFTNLGASQAAYSCSVPNNIYYMNEFNEIVWCSVVDTNKYKIYDISDVLKELKFKKGDKVLIMCCGERLTGTVTRYVWSEFNNRFEYEILDENNESWLLGPGVISLYKEDPVVEEKPALKSCDLNTSLPEINMSEYSAHKVKLNIDGYEISEVDGEYFLVKKHPYPKTLQEAHKLLYPQSDDDLIIQHLTFYKKELRESLQKLLMCRDAFIKVYDPDWTPDWANKDQIKYCITYYQNSIDLIESTREHYMLAFPTIEMRDIFADTYENLIVECKELL